MEAMSLKEKISTVFSVAYACPYDIRNPECAALPLRKRSISERLEMLREMEERELDEILTAHEICRLNWREALNHPPKPSEG